MLIWICPLFGNENTQYLWVLNTLTAWLLADYNKLTDCTVDDVALVT